MCATPLEVIDKALEIASRPGVIFCSFGDMLRVPGTGRDLFQVRGAGGDVRVVLAARRPADRPAEPRPPGRLLRHRLRDDRATQRDDGVSGPQARHPELQPAGVPRARTARHRGDHAVTDLPRPGLPGGRARVQRDGRQYPGNWRSATRSPIVVTGFEPLDILEGVRRTVAQLERGEHTVDSEAIPAPSPGREPGGAGHAGGCLRGSLTGPGAASG